LLLQSVDLCLLESPFLFLFLHDLSSVVLVDLDVVEQRLLDCWSS
jgi:hypothetical protein